MGRDGKRLAQRPHHARAAPGAGRAPALVDDLRSRDRRHLRGAVGHRRHRSSSDWASRLPTDEQSRLRAHPTANHEAYTLYLKGRYFWNKRTKGNIETALDYFQQAVDLDPGYSRAWVGIADTWIFRGWYSLLAPRDAFPKAKAAALKALEFDSTLAEAHASLAHIYLEFDHDWDAAEREYRRAIQLEPTYPTAHHWYGGFLSAMGRHDEALQQAETAQAARPAVAHHSDLGRPALLLRAAERERASPSISRRWSSIRTSLPRTGISAGCTSRPGMSRREWPRPSGRWRSTRTTSSMWRRSGMRTRVAGRTREARAILARLAQAAKERHVSAYHVAVIYMALGDLESGLTWLERAYDEQSPWIGYMRVDPRLDPVRGRPRFARLLGKAHLDF